MEPENFVGDKVEIEKVMEIAKQYSKGLISKFNVKAADYDSDDLTSEFMINFLKNDYAQKYDAQVCSLQSYIYLGLRRLLISYLRRMKYRKDVSIDAQVTHGNEGESFTLADVLSDGKNLVEDVIHDVVFEKVIESFPKKMFGHINDRQVFDFHGVEFDSSVRSLASLYLFGFQSDELAGIFHVTSGRVRQLLKEAFGDLKMNLVSQLN